MENNNWVTNLTLSVSQKDETKGEVEGAQVEAVNARGMQAIGLNAWYSKQLAIRDVNMAILPNRVTAIIQCGMPVPVLSDRSFDASIDRCWIDILRERDRH